MNEANGMPSWPWKNRKVLWNLCSDIEIRISWFYTCDFILNTFMGRGNLYGCGYKNTVFILV